MEHALVKLAHSIDWTHLNEVLGEFYEEAVVGQPPKPTRLMAGLLYLKHTYGLSDEALLECWVESPYFQYFCGEAYFQHKPPIHPTSLTRYRQRCPNNSPEAKTSFTACTRPDVECISKDKAHTCINTGFKLKTIIVDKGYHGPQFTGRACKSSALAN